MAEERKNRAVYGSLAYDFTAVPEFYPEREREPERRGDDYARRRVVIPAPPVIGEEESTRRAAAAKQGVSPAAILGCALAAVMVVLFLMARIQLTEVTDMSAQLESQLVELESEQNRLRIEYESAFNLAEIEEYATTTLGMQKPREEQIYYLDSSVPDKATIIKEDTGSGLWSEVKDFFSSIFA